MDAQNFRRKSVLRITALVFGALLPALLFAEKGLAWGLRGHHTVCEAAIFNVKEERLKTFAKTRIVMAGHICNIPDTSWKNRGQDITALGSPAHFVDPEVLGLAIPDIGLDYSKLEAQFTGQENKHKPGKIQSLHREFGSLWWRADQFSRLAIELFSLAQKSPAPANRSEEQDMKLTYNQGVSQGMVRLFLMGHFVGDAGQPFHSSADYDGYGKGHGGIHSFYEEAMVDRQDERLTLDVIQEARRLRKMAEATAKLKKPTPQQLKELGFLMAPTPLERMRALSVLSSADADLVFKADKLKKTSELKSEKGMELKTPAQREITDKLVAGFRPLLVKHMGRSAALLSLMWDEVYVKSGKPDLGPYKNYYYPFEPDFIAPDYISEKLPAPAGK